jgi:uncharacterized protein (TIGR00369 family)
MAILEKEAWLRHLRELHAATAFGALNGELLDVDEDSLTLHITLSEAVLTPFGRLHGGISMFLAETAASTHACWGVDLEKKLPVGIEINGSHVAAAESGVVLATARVLNRAKRLIVHDVDITMEESGQLLSKARVTNYYRNISG